MEHGDRWLTLPVMLHSSRADTCTLTPEQCAYRSGYWRYWYQADLVYGLSTTYFFLAAIGVCLIGFWLLKLAPASLWGQAWWQKLVGLFRFASYRRYELKALRWQTPSIAVLFLLGSGAVFFFAMTLGPKPYYWQNTRTLSYGNSPPIATRTGWMALACTPFLLILGTKANMIASLTGVSHERLIVFHNWVAWAMLVLALIHTFPFIVHHIWKGDMVMQWNTGLVYWSGIAALIPQAYLTFMSLPYIRNAYYEFFKATHYIAAIAFLFFFFLHCEYRLTSWDYFIAAGALYAASWLYSQIRTFLKHGISLRATIVPVSDHALKVTIPISNLTWQPGEHVFLRFLTLGAHALTAHPFTICSSPNAPSPADGGKESSSSSALVFYVQPRGGISARLASMAAKRPGVSVPVLIDGPYGGVRTRPLHAYDRGLVVACGAGAGFSLPFVMNWLLDVARRSPGCGDGESGRRMRVVVSTRDARIVEWYETALVEFLEANRLPLTLDGVEILVYLTSGAGPGLQSSGQDSEQSEEKHVSVAERSAPAAAKLPFKIFEGRPDISAAVRDATLESGVSVGIAVCGPAGVLKAAQDEAAAAQLRILGSKIGSKEVYLHSECFSW
ncbi:putative FRE ferric reductase-like transmembrane component [Phialemonium atrogriseum]|uniref:FRE ferric reductase-like transmembrane component n=1 Tax=Phialemonium atrogriseum TaxID=1093897 RepID=A0AAJ0BTJ5_9PEZI|nr:putative FRE ferric reductase-like transmembrane component [Phialemonium atrogriseum]KAK1764210.1 putative FRE ferric reductase-like transmembrane component [Phialemonium atrogriseum]